MRIAYVCFSSYGGSGVIASALARGMADRGHEVHVVCSDPELHERALGDGIRRWPVRAAEYPLFERPLYAVAVAAALEEVGREASLDLVHVHYAVPHATSAYLARQMLGPDAFKIVTTLHGTDVTRVGVERGVRSVNRFSVAASDGITVPSAYLRDAARDVLALGDREIEVIENFVDTDQFAPAEPDRGAIDALFAEEEAGAPLLVHVSNFRPVKRVVDTVDVLARIREHRPARLLLIGDGPDRAAVQARAHEQGVGGAVAFLGTTDDVPRYVAGADLFLLTSETESFGLAALEAQSCGVPVVAYGVGGLGEVIRDGETGALAKSGDVAALADAALALLADDDARRRMGARAREDVLLRYRHAAALDRYERYYRRVCGDATK